MLFFELVSIQVIPGVWCKRTDYQLHLAPPFSLKCIEAPLGYRLLAGCWQESLDAVRTAPVPLHWTSPPVLPVSRVGPCLPGSTADPAVQVSLSGPWAGPACSVGTAGNVSGCGATPVLCHTQHLHQPAPCCSAAAWQCFLGRQPFLPARTECSQPGCLLLPSGGSQAQGHQARVAAQAHRAGRCRTRLPGWPSSAKLWVLPQGYPCSQGGKGWVASAGCPPAPCWCFHSLTLS